MAQDTFAVELNQRTNATPLRYFYLTPRKSSQPSAARSETSSTLERELKRGKDCAKSHQRDTSNTSQESYDIPSPETPISVNKASANKGNTPRIVEDGQGDILLPESPTRKSKTVTIAVPTDIPPLEPASQIPKGLAFRGGLPHQSLRRKSSLKTPADVKMGDQVDNKPVGAGSASKEFGKQLADLQEKSDRGTSKEESFVEIDGISVSTQPTAEREPPENNPLPKANGSIIDSERLGDSQAQDSVSYASALRTGLSGDDDHKDQDDDDSYPDLDEMGMDELHRPPPRGANSGIRWAPWNVPFKRRGQTLVVLMHSLSIVATVSLFFAFCANPFAWPLLLLYLLHVLSSKAATDGSLKYRYEWFRKSYVWHFFADYFPARLHKTHDLPSTRKYIFGYHPHGIISHGAWAAFATDALGFSEKFPGITNSLLTLDSNFRIPFYREYVLGMGVRSVSKESIVNILTKGGPNGEGMGRGVTVVIGGARESLEAQPGMLRLILRERKGFIKLAVRCGADLVPVLAFGENDLYDQLQPKEHPYMHKIQMFLLKVWKFTLPFLHGRGIFNYDVGLMPYRRPLNIVVGGPIKVRQSSSVNAEEINRLHGLYVAELEKLWDRYKDEFAPDRKEEMQILP
ncbi:diacylglycerol acyltransferase-domain-containing protein [Xylariaceae sp. FL1651]|nr:diacylglycerol acyltransferase-domain-containing protein [Xylariaceae sp. FL1651]